MTNYKCGQTVQQDNKAWNICSKMLFRTHLFLTGKAVKVSSRTAPLSHVPGLLLHIHPWHGSHTSTPTGRRSALLGKAHFILTQLTWQLLAVYHFNAKRKLLFIFTSLTRVQISHPAMEWLIPAGYQSSITPQIPYTRIFWQVIRLLKITYKCISFIDTATWVYKGRVAINVLLAYLVFRALSWTKINMV